MPGDERRTTAAEIPGQQLPYPAAQATPVAGGAADGTPVVEEETDAAEDDEDDAS